MKTVQLFTWLLLVACSSPASEAQTQTVYITKSGTKYHEENCRVLRQTKIAIELKTARERGYEACHVCNPSTESQATNSNQPDSASEQQSTTSSEKAATIVARPKTSASKQCTSLTKAGLRCKRTTSSANGRCYQHQ